MIILPAIDIKDGKCVRLVKGDFATVHTVAENHIETAKSFEEKGAKWLHMVDLDGAKDGNRVNSEIFFDCAKNTSLKIEIGGGIRTLDDVELYLSNGIERVIIGSAALTNPELVKMAVNEFGKRIAVGIDARNGLVATQGWLEDSDVNYIDLALEMSDIGVKYFIFTDISKDGTLSGVNSDQLDALNKALGGKSEVIASGGVRSVEDIKICKAMNLYGVICGKSIYSGSLDLTEALEIAR